jgi:hypothetical protein
LIERALQNLAPEAAHPGEYAVVENTPGKLNMQIWDFTWEPGAKYVPDTRSETPDAKKH